MKHGENLYRCPIYKRDELGIVKDVAVLANKDVERNGEGNKTSVINIYPSLQVSKVLEKRKGRHGLVVQNLMTGGATAICYINFSNKADAQNGLTVPNGSTYELINTVSEEELYASRAAGATGGYVMFWEVFK